MSTWKALLLRFIYAASIAVGGTGSVMTILFAIRIKLGTHFADIHLRYVFPLLGGLSLAWFVSCLASGTLLWRRHARGYRLAKLLSLLQIGSTILVFLLPVLFHGERSNEILGDLLFALGAFLHPLALSYALTLLFLLQIFFRKFDFCQEAQSPSQTASKFEARSGAHPRPGLIYLVRGLGIANIFFGSLGIVFTVIDAAVSYLHRNSPIAGAFPLKIFFAGVLIDLAFVAGLGFAGYWLFRLDRRGVVLSIGIMASELAFWLICIWTPPLSDLRNFGLLPQILTGYPVLSLPLLIWGTKRLDRYQAWKPGRVAQT